MQRWQQESLFSTSAPPSPSRLSVIAARAYGVTCCCPLPLQVMNGAILQQVFVVEFVIQSQMCDDCHRVEAKDFWKAVVQVRQKVGVC